jgi:hypothetical protein
MLFGWLIIDGKVEPTTRVELVTCRLRIGNGSIETTDLNDLAFRKQAQIKAEQLQFRTPAAHPVKPRKPVFKTTVENYVRSLIPLDRSENRESEQDILSTAAAIGKGRHITLGSFLHSFTETLTGLIHFPSLLQRYTTSHGITPVGF